MSRARIVNGRWHRNIGGGWANGNVWRSDMFKTVLADPRLREAAFAYKGRTVVIPVEDLRRVLVGGSDHYEGGKIWGPFNIDLDRKEVDGKPVSMQIV